jgi:pyrroloquinoline quinone (PQQ) biosynthesis protein C
MKASGNAHELERLVASRNEKLLRHPYFERCRSGQLSRTELLEIVEQLYCFSVFFERVLARRIAEYSSRRDPRVIALARMHMREEIGHAQMFGDCLVANGRSAQDVDELVPRTFTKALFGYLTVTIQHENEHVSNVAIMQVMESIGFHFFSATLAVMQAHRMLADALRQHAEDDAGHAQLGLDLAESFDAKTMADCRRIIDDLYRLMDFVLEEWLDVVPEARLGSVARPARVQVGSPA